MNRRSIMNHLSRRGLELNGLTYGEPLAYVARSNARSWLRSFRMLGFGLAACLVPSLAHAEAPQTRVDASLSSDREAEALFCILEASLERSATKRDFRSLYHECAARRSEYLAERAP
jgi:hypothetical protein